MNIENIILNYLSRHDWAWIPAEKIIRDCKCTLEDVNRMYYCESRSRANTQKPIERKQSHGRVMYRYIGDSNYPKRDIVETVFMKWPDICTKEDVEQSTGRLAKDVVEVINDNPILPIDVFCNDSGGIGYKYIKNDCRSFLRCTERAIHKRKSATKKREEQWINMRDKDTINDPHATKLWYDGRWYVLNDVVFHDKLWRNGEGSILEYLRCRGVL